MNRPLAVSSLADIPHQYRDAPIGRLREYDNLGQAHEQYIGAQLLVGVCMDNRKHLRYPCVLVAPLLYRIEDNVLYGLREQG